MYKIVCNDTEETNEKKLKMIQSERLILKSYDASDLEDMFFLLCNEEIKETYMIPDFACKEDVIKMFYKIKDSSCLDEHFEYGIYLKNHLIGWINDTMIDGNTIEIGYVIHPEMKNSGFATEVLTVAIHELFKMGYNTVQAGLFEDNFASRRVMEKCGMRIINKTETMEYHGKNHACIYFEKRNESF